MAKKSRSGLLFPSTIFVKKMDPGQADEYLQVFEREDDLNSDLTEDEDRIAVYTLAGVRVLRKKVVLE